MFWLNLQDWTCPGAGGRDLKRVPPFYKHRTSFYEPHASLLSSEQRALRDLPFHPAFGAQVKRYFHCARRPCLFFQMPHHRPGKQQDAAVAAPGHFIFKNNALRLFLTMFRSLRQCQTLFRAGGFTVSACRAEIMRENNLISILFITLPNRQRPLLTMKRAQAAPRAFLPGDGGKHI